jgi:2'-5' RNA ligase
MFSRPNLFIGLRVSDCDNIVDFCKKSCNEISLKNASFKNIVEPFEKLHFTLCLLSVSKEQEQDAIEIFLQSEDKIRELFCKSISLTQFNSFGRGIKRNVLYVEPNCDDIKGLFDYSKNISNAFRLKNIEAKEPNIMHLTLAKSGKKNISFTESDYNDLIIPSDLEPIQINEISLLRMGTTDIDGYYTRLASYIR